MAKLKNNIIVALVNMGGTALTASTINVADAYKVIKFRRSLKKAFDDIADKERDILKDLGIEVGEGGKLSGDEEKIKRFSELQKALYEDQSEIESKTMPYETWHELQKENKPLQNPLIEDALEGILWEAPAE